MAHLSMAWLGTMGRRHPFKVVAPIWSGLVWSRHGQPSQPWTLDSSSRLSVQPVFERFQAVDDSTQYGPRLSHTIESNPIQSNADCDQRCGAFNCRLWIQSRCCACCTARCCNFVHRVCELVHLAHLGHWPRASSETNYPLLFLAPHPCNTNDPCPIRLGVELGAGADLSESSTRGEGLKP